MESTSAATGRTSVTMIRGGIRDGQRLGEASGENDKVEGFIAKEGSSLGASITWTTSG